MDMFDIRRMMKAPQTARNMQNRLYTAAGPQAPQGRQPAGNGGRPNSGGLYQAPPAGAQGHQELPESVYGETIINPTLHHDIGGVAEVPNSQYGESYFTLTFDNSGGGAAVRYRFGNEAAADLLGLGALPVATGGSNDVDAINFSLGTAPKLIGAIFMTTSSDQAQFSQEFTYHRGGKLDGSNAGSDPFPMTLAKRPTYENDLLLIIQGRRPWRFGQFEQGTITVLAGEVVTLDFTAAVVSGR